jgi:hypothetical protein
MPSEESRVDRTKDPTLFWFAGMFKSSRQRR